MVSNEWVPIPVAYVCGRSLAGIAGSNPAVGMNILSLVNVMCCACRGLCDWLIPRQGDPTLCVCVCVCVLEREQVQQ
jgi:hypothetical protein